MHRLAAHELPPGDTLVIDRQADFASRWIVGCEYLELLDILGVIDREGGKEPLHVR